MDYTLHHHVGAASPEAAGFQANRTRPVIKIGLDVHALFYMAVAQHDHATPGAPRRFTPEQFVPWVSSLITAGHEVHVVYESCGFGFGLQRALTAAGATCHVISPQALDESRSGVKTDGRDARTLCLRLDRYVQGNRNALSVIRVPTEAEEQRRHVSRQREQLVRHRSKMQAQGRCLLVNHGLPAPAHWWMEQTWSRLIKLLPGWIVPMLEVTRPVLLSLHAQILALSARLEAAAPREAPRGLGKLTTTILGNEVCDWKRFNNRREVSSYTGLCPGEHSSGGKRKQGHVTKHGNPRLRAALVECAWRLVRFQPQYPPVRKRMHLLGKGARATGAARKKAIVTVARHLAVDLWRIHTGQCSAAKLGLQL
ncbi:MAG: IS110 family transposase [Verrucomicrobiaceae bacterium]|jgi:transposase|nr:IS110 family transposase [Verrucomicrobiaceae bacterium]